MTEVWKTFSVWMYMLCIFIASTYAVPPRIVSPPTVTLAQSEGITIQWSAWDENTDDGDGPVASYLAVAREASGDPNAEFTVTVDAGLDTSVKVEPLTWETEYEIAVICVDGNGDRGDPSPLLTVTTPCGVPREAPTIDSLEAVNTTALRLTWSAPDQSSWRCSSLDDIQVSYEYKRNTVSTFPSSSNNPRTPINDGELVIGNLDPCSTYDVLVYMYATTSQESSEGEVTSTINGTTEFEKVGPISSPSHISQSNLGPNFILTWRPPSTGYCLPDSYILTHAVTSRLACPDEEVTKVVEEVTDITVTTYLLNDLDYYSEYEINITGINELGPGETVTYYAPTVDGVPTTAPVPMYREDMAAPGELNFNWTETPCEEIQGKFGRYLYELYRPQWDEMGRTFSLDNREAKFTGLLGCTEYKFRVRMTNLKGPGPFSELLPATTPTEAPGHVKDLSSRVVAGTPTSLNVSWTPDTDTPCAPESYQLQYTLSVADQCEDVNTTSPTMLPTVAYPDTYVVIENLQPYSTYEISIFAQNEGGNSSKVSKMVSTGEQVPTGMPADVSVTQVDYDRLSFSYSELPCGTRLGQIIGYNYELRDVSTDEVMNGTTNEMMVTLTGLSRSTEYSFKVRAGNSAGFGPFSGEVLQSTTLGLPSAPVDLKIDGNPSSPITLVWSPPSTPNGDILSYQMYYWNASEDISAAEMIDIENTFGGQAEVMIEDLEPLTEYIFGVRATNEAGQGPWSNNVTEEIWEGAPSPVVNLMATEVSEDSLYIQWEAPLDPKGIISKYTFVYSVSDRPYSMMDDTEEKYTEVLTPTEMGFTLYNLEPATEYEITVTASTRREDGEPSTITQYTLVPDDIPAPEEVFLEYSVVTDDGKLAVKLPPPQYPYATGYQIGVHCADVSYEPVFFTGDNATDCSYITGEVPRNDEEQIFYIGDDEMYGKYHNKPLDPEREYKVYVSIISRTDMGSSSSWGSEPLEVPEPSPERKAGLIILWIFIIILLIVLILLILWCVFVRLRKNKEEKKPPGTPEEQVPLE